MPQVTNNNTVTKIDVQLDCVLLQRRKGFPWVTRSYRIGTNRNIFVTGFAIVTFIIYPLELRVWVLIWLLYLFSMFWSSLLSKFYRSQHHDKITEHENITISQIEIFAMVVSLFHESIKSFCIITSRQLRKKSKKKVQIHLMSSGFLGKFNQNRFQSSNIYIK